MTSTLQPNCKHIYVVTPHMHPCVFMAANLGILLSACHSVWQLISLSFFPTDHPSMQSPNCQSGCLKVHSFIHPPTLLVCLVHRPSASLSRLPSIHTHQLRLPVYSVSLTVCMSVLHALKRKVHQGDFPGLHRTRWRQPSTSPMNTVLSPWRTFRFYMTACYASIGYAIIGDILGPRQLAKGLGLLLFFVGLGLLLGTSLGGTVSRRSFLGHFTSCTFILRPRQNGRHFADEILKLIFFKKMLLKEAHYPVSRVSVRSANRIIKPVPRV